MGTTNTPIVTVFGDAGDGTVSAAIELLDRSGLSYQRVAAPDPGLACEGASIGNLSREGVINFLREHGARFEDS